jgi:hypothetical protein
MYIGDDFKKKGHKALNDVIDIGTLANLEIRVIPDGGSYIVKINCNYYYNDTPFVFIIPKKNVNKGNWDLICLGMARDFYEEAANNLKEVIQSMIEKKHFHDMAEAIVNDAKNKNNGEHVK